MNDPDDTDPMLDATLVDTDPGPGPIEDTAADEGEEESEQDSDEFWRWLPTMGLAHRRRRELVERPSSDGAAFAAYAGAARPAVAAATMPFEAKVRIASGLAEGEAPGSRDALTVVSPRRGRRSPAVAIGLAAVAAVSVTVVAGSSHLPAWRQGHVASTGQAATTPRQTNEPSAEPALHAPRPGPTEEPLPTGPAPTASAGATRAESTSPVNSGPPRPRERSAPARAAESPAQRGARPAAPAAPAASLTKDQFFEVQ
jgi:hypothetical protein